MRTYTNALLLSSLRLRDASMLAALVIFVLFAVVVALLERQHGAGAADRSLTGAAFGIALPLAAWGVVRRATHASRLDRSFAELARHGADRRLLALGQLTATALACLMLGMLLGAVTVVAARGLADPATPADAWTSASIGAMAGAAYACWFTLGASFGRNGGGRTAFLMLDWALGASASALALPLPRGHILNLLGAQAPLGLSQAASALALTVLTFLLLALAIYRIPR